VAGNKPGIRRLNGHSAADAVVCFDRPNADTGTRLPRRKWLPFNAPLRAMKNAAFLALIGTLLLTTLAADFIKIVSAS